jgi:hypothetical protein
MEQAAQQFGYGNSSPYQRYTDNFAYALKQAPYNGDSVILVFLTHDDKGSTATGPDQGYADKVLVSYWGIKPAGRFNSEPGTYEHEIVHAYGALDEYIGGNGVGCNYWPSGLAVSPMYEMYKNTNYDTCPLSTKQGVMYYPYNDLFHIFWWQISGASRKWIGWGDYDNDGILDPLDNSPWGNIDTIGVFRNGVWYLRNSNTAGSADLTFTFGQSGDKPVVGDWNGDGTDTIGVFRNGSFFLRNSNTAGSADLTFTFGQSGDKPVVGDWNGDGTDTIGVYRNGTFFLRNSNTNGAPDLTFIFGQAGDVPVIGDWNGDGTDTVGVFRNGMFYLRNSNTNGAPDLTFIFGQAGDVPVIGDWNGDGIDTIGVFRNGTFFLRNSNTGGIADLSFIFGQAGDVPVVGDWI